LDDSRARLKGEVWQLVLDGVRGVFEGEYIVWKKDGGIKELRRWLKYRRKVLLIYIKGKIIRNIMKKRLKALKNKMSLI
jgi:hypothetical protein